MSHVSSHTAASIDTSTWHVRSPILWYLQCWWEKLHQKNVSFITSLCHFSALIIANQHDPVAFCFDPLWHWDSFSSLNLSVMLPTFHVSPSAGHRKWVFHGREWAGVRGVQPAGQGPKVKGRVQCHGLLPGRSVSVRNSLLALFFCSLLVRKHDFNFVSESQDGKVQVLSLFLRLQPQFWWEWGSSLWPFPGSSVHRRAVAQRCPSPPMKNLISVGGQHQGIIPSYTIQTVKLTDWNWSYHIK